MTTGTAGGVGAGSAFTAPQGFFFQTVRQADGRYTLPRGNGMNFEYYSNGKVFRHATFPGNETTTFAYNDFRHETVQTNPRGHERRFFFDPYGNPVRIIEENGAERRYSYDPANPYNRLTKTGPQGYQTQYAYDTQGNVTRITNPSGATVEFSYFNSFNQPGKAKDARGNYTLLKYDAQGNPALFSFLFRCKRKRSCCPPHLPCPSNPPRVRCYLTYRLSPLSRVVRIERTPGTPYLSLQHRDGQLYPNKLAYHE